MFQVGLYLTKNNEKYIELESRLISHLNDPAQFNFIQLCSEDDIKTHIDTLNILHCYEIQVFDHLQKPIHELCLIQPNLALNQPFL